MTRTFNQADVEARRKDVAITPTQPKKVKMKKWSDNSTTMVSYRNLIAPLKSVLDKGYRLLRKQEVKSFDYDGYNIGKNELAIFPSPKNQLSEKSLEKSAANHTNLIDIVLNIAFLLGMEQGRRAERREQVSTETLISAIESYRERNSDLRLVIDELNATLAGRELHLSGQELDEYIQSHLSSTKNNRINEAREDIKTDPIRSAFTFGSKQRTSFNELSQLVSTMSSSCTKEQWADILKDRGWSFDEWKAKCVKKNISTHLK